MDDVVERMEVGADAWAASRVAGDRFQCDCGQWAPLCEGKPTHPSPYAAPVCPDCFDEWMQEQRGADAS